jgi:meso-butanediol dehydrogenase / (S,S)-butanediol dehydrogenase / diacetyl reductase
MRLKDAAAVITGAGSGIGRAIAARFREEGARVAVVDANAQAAQQTVADLSQSGVQAIAVAADVSQSDQVQEALRHVVREFGRLDILVNNAGINIAKPVEEFPDDDWRRIIGVNLDGVWFCCRYGIPYLLEAGGGAIVNIASVGAFQTSHHRAPYMATKGGVVSLTRALALDFAERNIRVNAIAPGIVETNLGAKWRTIPANIKSVEFLTPMKRFGQPLEIANAAVFLASSEASFITGETLVVDGGMLCGNHFGRPELWEGFQ